MLGKKTNDVDSSAVFITVIIIAVIGGVMLWQRYERNERASEQQVEAGKSEWDSLSVDEKIMKFERDIEQLRAENIRMSQAGITNPTAFEENDKEIVQKTKALNWLKSMRD